MSLPYHEGELIVQARAGEFDKAIQNARVIRAHLPPQLERFLSTQPWIVLGGARQDGAVWASVLTGPPGFVTAPDDSRVRIAARIDETDPLHRIAMQPDGDPVGLLAIDLSRRMRARINGDLHRDGDVLIATVRETYPNCMKYIQRRAFGLTAQPASRGLGPDAVLDGPLSADQAALVAAADTVFLATAGPDHTADCSHRGGPPGFLAYDPTSGTLRMPDYPGNGMFNTLGNLELDPRIGLTIPDFSTGRLLQLTGHAHTYNDRPDDLTITMTIHGVRDRDAACLLASGPVEYSPFLQRL